MGIAQVASGRKELPQRLSASYRHRSGISSGNQHLIYLESLHNKSPFTLLKLVVQQPQPVVSRIQDLLLNHSHALPKLQDWFYLEQETYCSDRSQFYLVFEDHPISLEDQFEARMKARMSFTEAEALAVGKTIVMGLKHYRPRRIEKMLLSALRVNPETLKIYLRDPWIVDSEPMKEAVVLESPEMLLSTAAQKKTGDPFITYDIFSSDLFLAGLICLQILTMARPSTFYTKTPTEKHIDFKKITHYLATLPEPKSSDPNDLKYLLRKGLQILLSAKPSTRLEIYEYWSEDNDPFRLSTLQFRLAQNLIKDLKYPGQKNYLEPGNSSDTNEQISLRQRNRPDSGPSSESIKNSISFSSHTVPKSINSPQGVMKNLISDRLNAGKAVSQNEPKKCGEVDHGQFSKKMETLVSQQMLPEVKQEHLPYEYLRPDMTKLPELNKLGAETSLGVPQTNDQMSLDNMRSRMQISSRNQSKADHSPPGQFVQSAPRNASPFQIQAGLSLQEPPNCASVPATLSKSGQYIICHQKQLIKPPTESEIRADALHSSHQYPVASATSSRMIIFHSRDYPHPPGRSTDIKLANNSNPNIGNQWQFSHRSTDSHHNQHAVPALAPLGQLPNPISFPKSDRRKLSLPNWAFELRSQTNQITQLNHPQNGPSQIKNSSTAQKDVDQSLLDRQSLQSDFAIGNGKQFHIIQKVANTARNVHQTIQSSSIYPAQLYRPVVPSPAKLTANPSTISYQMPHIPEINIHNSRPVSSHCQVTTSSLLNTDQKLSGNQSVTQIPSTIQSTNGHLPTSHYQSTLQGPGHSQVSNGGSKWHSVHQNMEVLRCNSMIQSCHRDQRRYSQEKEGKQAMADCGEYMVNSIVRAKDRFQNTSCQEEKIGSKYASAKARGEQFVGHSENIHPNGNNGTDVRKSAARNQDPMNYAIILQEHESETLRSTSSVHHSYSGAEQLNNKPSDASIQIKNFAKGIPRLLPSGLSSIHEIYETCNPSPQANPVTNYEPATYGHQLEQKEQRYHQKCNPYYSTIVEVNEETPEQSESQSQTGEQEYVVEQYETGSRYQGYKRNNMRNGKGIFFYQNGGHYEGQWKDDKMHGYGKLYYEGGRLAYEGHWRNDEFHGYGKVYNDHPSRLEGPFDYRNFDLLENNWIYYEGNLISDTKEGRGIIKLTNGESFQGDFRADRIQGFGKFTKIDGIVINGIWRDSQLIKIL